MTPEQQKEALSKIAEASVLAENSTGLPAELSAAQCIFESGWLSRCPGNNAFGIKSDGHGAGVQYFSSKEFLNGEWIQKPEAFEKYNTLADCFTDHARLITTSHLYQGPWQVYKQTHGLERLIRGICPIYATDPEYTDKILKEARSPTLLAAITTARQSANELN